MGLLVDLAVTVVGIDTQLMSVRPIDLPLNYPTTNQIQARPEGSQYRKDEGCSDTGPLQLGPGKAGIFHVSEVFVLCNGAFTQGLIVDSLQ